MSVDTKHSKQTPEVILYWLNYSRSQRILWLLEELNVNYDLKVFERDASFRAPSELRKIHPLGKSPVISVDGKIIGESGYITQFILSEFDTEKKLTPTDKDGIIDMNYYLHYAEGSLQPLLVSLLVLNKARAKIPWAMKMVGNKLIDLIIDSYYLPELYLNLDFLEAELEKKDYFAGGKLTGADILMSFPILACFNGSRVVLNKPYPNLKKWVKMIDSNEIKLKCDKIVKSYQ